MSVDGVWITRKLHGEDLWVTFHPLLVHRGVHHELNRCVDNSWEAASIRRMSCARCSLPAVRAASGAPRHGVAAGLRICLVLLDAVGELGHLIEELAVFAHLRVDLLH